MTPALVMMPSTKGLISKDGYLARCMMHVMKEGYFPISKDAYDACMHLEHEKFLTQVFQVCACMFLFVDFGVDAAMASAIERATKKEMQIVYVKINSDKPGEFALTLDDILAEISHKSDISIEKLQSKSRKRELVDARRAYFRRAREVFGTGASYEKIGMVAGGKDHATVLTGIKESMKVQELIDQYNRYYPK